MVVPDDPFQEPLPIRDPARSGHASPSPILRIHSEVDIAASRAAAVASHSGEPTPDTSHPVSGGKTPRRVQWTADHVINLAPLEQDGDVGGDGEGQALDHHNLRQVNDALESFKRGRHVASQLSLNSMASSDNTDDLNGDRRPLRSDEHDRGRPTATSEEDYDYRLDNDPEDPEDTSDHEMNLEHHILDAGANDHVYAYVPLGETDGLPSVPNEESRHATAAEIVRAHSSKWGTLRRRVRTGSLTRKARAKRAADDMSHSTALDTVTEKGRDSVDQTAPLNPGPPQVEAAAIQHRLNALNRPPPGVLPGGASVLSSLLTLYNKQQLDSGLTTPGSSRPPSLYDSPATSDGELPPTHNDRSTDRKKRSLPWPRKSGEFGEEHRRDSMMSIADREPEPSGFVHSFHRAMDNMFDNRPKAARSSAGVFGALIQNTGAVAAAAAPTSSTLIPSAKRAGYHLKRYELSGPPATSSAYESASRNSRSSLGSRSNSRPTSRPPSRPTSLYSSPTVVDGGTPDDKNGAHIEMVPLDQQRSKSSDNLQQQSKSSDNLLEMKKKARPRPKPISLKSIERGAEKWLKAPRTPSFVGTPTRHESGDHFAAAFGEEDRRHKEWEAEKRRRKKAKEQRKKQEVFIIQHVAAILARQQFLLKLARALMMFGSPSHRLETQIQATARVLEINAQVVYLPGIMLVSFADEATHTSETKFLKQATGLDLGKLLAVHNVYWDVVHDRVAVDEASKVIDTLMTMPPHYNALWTIIIGGCCSAIIVIPSFYGSFIDALMAAPLGMVLVGVQMVAAKNDMLANVFEITVATLISFFAALLASTDQFCYTALVSGGVVLILPGYIVLTGALELASRNITAGAVRMAYSIMYSLFLGFGISLGALVYSKISGKEVINSTNWQCDLTHVAGSPWFKQTPSAYWYFLAVPAYSFVLSLRNQQPIFRKELPVMILISCAGWVTNHFSSLAFSGRSDIVSALGSFVVGMLGNLYGRFFKGASFPVMVTGILFQLPSGLSQGGIFNFAATTGDTSTQYSTGFSVAEQLVSVAIGLT